MSKKLTFEQIHEEALKYKTKGEFSSENGGYYKTACKNGWIDPVCSHMPKNVLSGKAAHNQKWTKETIELQSSKYENRYQFKKNDPSAFNAAKRLGLLDSLFPEKQKFRNEPITKEEALQKALQYKTKSELKEKDPYLYRLILKNKWSECVAHMPQDRRPGLRPHNKQWDRDSILAEIEKFSSIAEWKSNSSGSYSAAGDLGILAEVGSKFEKYSTLKKWDLESIKKDIHDSGYKTTVEWRDGNPAAYNAARKLGLLEEIYPILDRNAGTSSQEQDILQLIKQKFPKAHSSMFSNKDPKYSVKKYEIDIYIPELRKGIEFDGKFHHSFAGLKRGRPNWTDDQIEHYHEDKDAFFLERGIQILHIKEESWLSDKKSCLDSIWSFLG